MTKIPFYNTTVKKITEVKTRDILKADFLFEGHKFSVFTTHLLTFKNGEYKRKINAKALENFTKNTKNAIKFGVERLCTFDKNINQYTNSKEYEYEIARYNGDFDKIKPLLSDVSQSHNENKV